jgi:hypothetical protein
VNKKLVRRIPLLAVACATFLFLFNLVATMPVWGRPDALEDGVERLAKKAAALPHEPRMTLVWTNHAALSQQRVERLRATFAAQMEAAQVRFVQGESAPALRVAIEQTPSQIVFTATVTAAESTSVVIEEVARAAAGIDRSSGNSVRLEKELLCHQETKILSAALLPAGTDSEKRLAVLTEEALLIYGGGPGNWNLENSKVLPGPRQAQRSAHGQLIVAAQPNARVGILLPGRRCEADVTDQSVMACANLAAEWPSGRLLALPSCGTQAWWLRSDGVDWTEEGRLLLHSAGAGKEAVAAEVVFAGPVISISAGDHLGSATAVVRDLSSGNYEVYRVALACGN